MNELSIIIPTLNEQKYLPALLDSVLAQKYTGKLQVIIVDGQSTDKTKKVAEKYSEKFKELVIVSSKANVGLQRNVGASKAKYEYLLFLDADVVLPNNCLRRVSERVKDRKNFIAATFHRSSKLTVSEISALIAVYTLFIIAWLARTPVINGDFILTTKKVHDSIGGFKEGAILGEDTDYGVRAIKAGAKYMFISRTYIIASDRRLRHTSRIKLIRIWSTAYLKARKGKPTYSGVEYPFGNYED